MHYGYDRRMASTRKLPSGRFQGIAKEGRALLGTKTFDLQRDALAWAQRTELAAAGGLDVKAGKATVRVLLPQWLEYREHAVSAKTYTTDQDLMRLVDATLKARAVASIKRADIEAWMLRLKKQGQSYASISRRRDSMSAFFSWLVDDNRVGANPVRNARQPSKVNEEPEMYPFTEAELGEVVARIAERSPAMADVALVLGWTGLRWGEARALAVSDIRRGADGTPTSIRVARSQSEGYKAKTTKSGKSRNVPVLDIIAPALDRLTADKGRSELVLTGERGGQLWGNRFREVTDWKTVALGRRLHDLRHTAACLWLGKGVDLSTVQAWLGHSSATTTNKYLHYLGTSADSAAVALINSKTK